MATQKVIVPRGLIKSGETTIIEIPANLQGSPAVIAKPKRSSGQGASFQGTSSQGSSFQGNSYQENSYQGNSYQGNSSQGTSTSRLFTKRTSTTGPSNKMNQSQYNPLNSNQSRTIVEEEEILETTRDDSGASDSPNCCKHGSRGGSPNRSGIPYDSLDKYMSPEEKDSYYKKVIKKTTISKPKQPDLSVTMPPGYGGFSPPGASSPHPLAHSTMIGSPGASSPHPLAHSTMIGSPEQTKETSFGYSREYEYGRDGTYPFINNSNRADVSKLHKTTRTYTEKHPDSWRKRPVPPRTYPQNSSYYSDDFPTAPSSGFPSPDGTMGFQRTWHKDLSGSPEPLAYQLYGNTYSGHPTGFKPNLYDTFHKQYKPKTPRRLPPLHEQPRELQYPSNYESGSSFQDSSGYDAFNELSSESGGYQGANAFQTSGGYKGNELFENSNFYQGIESYEESVSYPGSPSYAGNASYPAGGTYKPNTSSLNYYNTTPPNCDPPQNSLGHRTPPRTTRGVASPKPYVRQEGERSRLERIEYERLIEEERLEREALGLSTFAQPAVPRREFGAPEGDRSRAERLEYEELMRQEEEHEYQEYFTPYLMSTPKDIKMWKPNSSNATAGSEKEIQAALEHMESAETERINKDLKDFQEARRRLIIDTTNIHAPSS